MLGLQSRSIEHSQRERRQFPALELVDDQLPFRQTHSHKFTKPSSLPASASSGRWVCMVHGLLIVLTDLLSWLTYCTVYHVLNCHCRQNLDDPIFLIWYDERRQKKGYRYGRVLAAYCRTQIYLQVTENIFVCFVEAWTFQASPSKTELAKHWFCWR